MENTFNYFPWARKGLSSLISEFDGENSETKNRPSLMVEAKFEETPVSAQDVKTKTAIEKSETKRIQLVGPGDINSISPNAILKISPKANSTGFVNDKFPYIEFWEPDFPWRYTPAKPTSDGQKLRPWLALLVCDSSLCVMNRLPDGRSYVTLNIKDEKQYKRIFPDPGCLWKSAHAQSIDDTDHPQISRLIAIRADEKNNPIELVSGTNYYALLIPSFETGRLRGLSFNDEVKLNDALSNTLAQLSAWEEKFDDQKNRTPRPFDFPVYYSWQFTAGADSFEKMAGRLKPVGKAESEKFKSSIPIDVARMGEGLDYNRSQLITCRTGIGMPAATQMINSAPESPFPSHVKRPLPSHVVRSSENDVYNTLKGLLLKNPVFEENYAETTDAPDAGKDDPWVVPPVYGAKHIMATSFEKIGDDQAPSWLSQLNLDIHYRAAAGLGKKTVQIHQEEFVNRAWQQIEAVNALNYELQQRLLSFKVNRSLKNKTLGRFRSNKGTLNPDMGKNLVSNMMQYFGSMKNAVKSKGDASLSSILAKSNIPKAFATATFQNMTADIARKVVGMDETQIMQSIADGQIYPFSELKFDLPAKDDLKYVVNHIYSVLIEKILKHFLSDYFSISRNNGIDYKKENTVEQLFTITKGNILFSDDPFANSSNPITVPYSHLNYYYNFFKNLDSSQFGEPGYQQTILNQIGKFLGDKNRHNYYGHTDRKIQSGEFLIDDINVLGIEDAVYENLFGSNTIITRVGGETGMYFVSKGKLKKSLDEGKGVFGDSVSLFTQFPNYNFYKDATYPLDIIVNSLHLNALVTAHLTNKSDSLIRLYDTEHRCWSIDSNFPIGLSIEHTEVWKLYYNPKNPTNGTTVFPVTYSYFPLKDCYHPLLYSKLQNFNPGELDGNELPNVASQGTSLHINGKKITQKIDELTSKIKINSLDLLNQITEYLMTNPDYIEINPKSNNLKNSALYKEFNTWDSYVVDFLRNNLIQKNKNNIDFQEKNKGIIPYFKYWDELDALRAICNSLRDPAPLTSPPPPIDKQQASDLFSGLDASEAYEQIKTVAESYYSQFFTEDGKTLRDRYIDELLQSKYPIMAYPIFPEPVYHYLKLFSAKFILPCVEQLKNDTIAVFQSDPAFTEAYLCGMNTEMGKELLWREYPTDRRGSYFRKFWDSETDVKDIRNDNFFDINPIHTWLNNLGNNHPESKTDLLIFAIKGQLMLQYPSTRVFLQRAVKNPDSEGKDPLIFDTTAPTDRNEVIILPVIQAFLKQDILLVGFKKNFNDVVGNPKGNPDYGYFLTFKEDVQDLSFSGKADEAENAAVVAKNLVNHSTRYGKHLSQFII